MTLTINPGFPFDEPYVVKLSDAAGGELLKLKEVWCIGAATLEPGTK
ncbi:MAG TPA: hypothetical protein P5279_07530 [Anaerohalosphaeraceae bacterium]|jgi:hypothetical protein|nr:hypothetical protein [Anaerohalosphaeraceae bacterium]HRT50327.1 hypothetical protein [Anaerohalosphaeraceae bacterium]HRT86257.1 hypothetical protein [Anaerohalosphaeraceae bacterium]